MSDPKRLLDELNELEPEARTALEAGRDIEPNQAAHGAVWAALVGQVPPGGGAGPVPDGVTAGGSGAASSTFGAAGFLKFLGIGAGAGVVVVVASQAMYPGHSPTDPAPTTTTASAPIAPTTASSSLAGEPKDEPVDDEESAPVKEEPTPGVAGAPAVRKGTVRDEARLIAAARQRLLREDPRGALRLLEQASQRYPNGILVQEREALAVEALAKSGQREAAASRAREFERAHPKSPLKSRVHDATR